MGPTVPLSHSSVEERRLLGGVRAAYRTAGSGELRQWADIPSAFDLLGNRCIVVVQYQTGTQSVQVELASRFEELKESGAAIRGIFLGETDDEWKVGAAPREDRKNGGGMDCCAGEGRLRYGMSDGWSAASADRWRGKIYGRSCP